MAILNINSEIAKMIKRDAKQADIGIGCMAHYYFLLGRFFLTNSSKSFEEIDKQVKEIVNDFKVTS